jgi:hypothetical protein
MYIYPIHQRTGQPRAVALHLSLGTDALFAAISVIPARARIAGGNQHKLRGILGGASRIEAHLIMNGKNMIIENINIMFFKIIHILSK